MKDQDESTEDVLFLESSGEASANRIDAARSDAVSSRLSGPKALKYRQLTGK